MTRRYIMECDNHIGAPHEIPMTMDADFYLGDNFDRKNCKKKEVESLTNAMTKHMGDYGDRFLSGNHELANFNTHHILETSSGRCFLTHGDFEAMGDKYAKIYRGLTPGAGWLTRLFVRLTANLRDFFRFKPNTICMDRAILELEAYNCDIYIVGHHHPKKTFVREYKGKTLYFLHRGLSVLNL